MGELFWRSIGGRPHPGCAKLAFKTSTTWRCLNCGWSSQQNDEIIFLRVTRFTPEPEEWDDFEIDFDQLPEVPDHGWIRPEDEEEE